MVWSGDSACVASSPRVQNPTPPLPPLVLGVLGVEPVFPAVLGVFCCPPLEPPPLFEVPPPELQAAAATPRIATMATGAILRMILG